MTEHGVSPAENEPLRRFLSSLPKLPARRRDGHKGDYGTAVLVAGSSEMSGAAALCGRSALVAGAGLVRLLVPESIQRTVAERSPEYMTVALPEDRAGRIALDALPMLEARLARSSAFAVGPGLGRSLGLELAVKKLFFERPEPAVFDADALNALAAREVFLPVSDRQLFFETFPAPPAARILTPHPGEFARMTGRPTPCEATGRRDAAESFVRAVRKNFASETAPIVLVLKGAGTVVTDGERTAICELGNPAMATGGSGDVLTGVITALAAQKMEPFASAVFGVALHALAGDLAVVRLGKPSLVASDIIDSLSEAFVSIGAIST